MQFGTGADRTLEEVGPQFLLTGERIRQITARAPRNSSQISRQDWMLRVHCCIGKNTDRTEVS